MSEKKRSQVADINRSLYDFTKSEEGYERYADGLTPEIVRTISAKKDEPEWMLQYRLDALQEFLRKPMPTWGVDLSFMNFDEYTYYSRSIDGVRNNWEDVPETIKNTFNRLGIPEAEQKF